MCNLHHIFAGDQVEKNWIDGACSPYGKRRVAYRVLMGNLRETDLLKKNSRRRKDNIKMDLQGVGCVGMYWTDLCLRIETGGSP
jgi:hypothetical protein